MFIRDYTKLPRSQYPGGTMDKLKGRGERWGPWRVEVVVVVVGEGEGSKMKLQNVRDHNTPLPHPPPRPESS